MYVSLIYVFECIELRTDFQNSLILCTALQVVFCDFCPENVSNSKVHLKWFLKQRINTFNDLCVEVHLMRLEIAFTSV